MVAVLILLGIGAIIAYVFYLISLQKAFEAVSPENRELTPGLVWLNFIPIFNLGWQFVVVIKLSNSLKKEYETRGYQESCGGGFGVGLAASICYIVSIIPYIGILASIGALVCWILHWVQIAGYKNRLLHG